METAQNVASSVYNTASKLIYGEQQQTESGQEPVSGKQGQGTAQEPFDQGNKDGDAPPSTSGGSSAPAPAPADDNSDPSTGRDVKEAQKPVQKQQGADKPMDEPTGEQKDAVKESKDEGEAAMAKRDPNDHSGEPMKMHDGSESKEEGSNEEKTEEEENKEKGTGEQWVKSTGLAADGGDFDATKPGAGREADRLLEEKGIDRSGDNRGPPEKVNDDGDKSEPKTSKLSKIKEKLHIGKS